MSYYYHLLLLSPIIIAIGRTMQERANNDLITENKKLDAQEYRETFLQG